MVRSLWAGLVLGLGAVAPLAAQGGYVTRIELREILPNPVDSTTTIPFDVFTEACNKGQRARVSLKIYNALVQEVGIAVLNTRSRQKLDDVRLPCGEYRARWDLKVRGDKPAQPGVYYAQLVVDGQRFTRKMIIARRAAIARDQRRDSLSQ